MESDRPPSGHEPGPPYSTMNRRRRTKSDQQRNPLVWGRHFWTVYDLIAETYPHRPSSKEKDAALDYFNSQKYLIPCQTCAANYRSIIKEFPPRVSSRGALQEWLATVKTQVAKHKAAGAVADAQRAAAGNTGVSTSHPNGGGDGKRHRHRHRGHRHRRSSST